MTFQFNNLNEVIRELMLKEVDLDVNNGALYLSSRLSLTGTHEYPKLLTDAIKNGNTETLANSLRNQLNITEERRRNGKVITAKVPITAAATLAEGEFNRFFIRAICRFSIDNGNNAVKIYRAKQVETPRPESDGKIGSIINAQILLNDLRNNQGVDSALGIPPGPNSGLSVEFV